MKKLIKIFIVLIILTLTSGLLFLGINPSTAEFTDDRDQKLQGSIAELEKIELGGLDQWISIRGADTNNPILLWLHGGPGSTQMPFAHEFDGQLEEEFIVVHWDQRGAGKSNHSGFSETTMSFEQYKADAVELINYLRNKFNQDSIYLLGHSWGTHFGLEVAAENPESIEAYIGVSQVVDSKRQAEIAWEWLVQEIAAAENQSDYEKLMEIGQPPFNHSQYREFASLVIEYGGNYDLSLTELALIALRASEYTVLDYYRLINGMNRGGGPLHSEAGMLEYNMLNDYPSLEIPVYFLIGRNDYNTPYELVREYYELLTAPEKGIIVFEDSAHTPMFAEPEKFTQTLIDIKN